MIAREIESWLREVAERPQVIHLFGLRQTGKTTLMEAFRSQDYPDSLYYPLYDLVTLRRYEGQPDRWVLELEEALKQKSGERLQVFVDEVQKIPAFFQAIQGLYERYKGKIKFWIWGSSARPLKRQRAETLAGRSLSKVLWPLSQSEILQKQSRLPCLFDPHQLKRELQLEEPRDYNRFLSRVLQQTMLPEPHLLERLSEAQDLLQAYQATYLENEIRRENLVGDIGVFEQFLALAASEDTSVVNYSSKAKVLGISPHTVRTYYGILEDTFVCTPIPAYSRSLRVQISKSPKIYFIDTGFARFISGERGSPPEGSPSFGSLVEGFVMNEIIKQVEYNSLPWRLSYLRTKTGLEVDVILSQGSQKVAAEIKSTHRVTPQDWKPIQMLMDLDPDIQHGIIFSRQSAPLELAPRIYNFPIWNL
ncbi:MAG: ATP-binding protein [Deltaproteobacteria bacterium]|nr:ATP-binding protein [Deltaproteobacteria bacterium]